MNFLLYLSPQSMEIYNMISKKVRVVENAPVCRQHRIYGWFDVVKNKMTMCTDQILSGDSPSYYINETLLHESAHIAQGCKMGMEDIKAFGLSKTDTPLSDRRESDLIVANKLSGPNSYFIEREAFWMEDKPNEVMYVLQKYCF